MKKDIVNRIRTELINAFNDVFDWFDVNNELLNYVPSDGGWSVRKVLEHISLTNQYLLILIRKGTAKALDNSEAHHAVAGDKSRLFQESAY